MYRAVWQELHEDGHCALASVRRCRENRSRPEEGPALVRATHEALEEYGKNNKKISQEAVLSILSLQDPGALADAVMPHLKVDYRKKIGRAHV